MTESMTVMPGIREPAGSLTLAMRREARLRPEYGGLYPGILADAWEPAAVLADRVMAAGLLRGAALGQNRILQAGHFEFRGGDGGSRTRPRREDR